jgi:hypothetical protein
MSESLKNLNRTHIMALGAIIVLALGYGYYKYMYSPASLKLTTAKAHADTAQASVTEKQAQLTTIQEKLDGASSKEGLGKNIIAKEAIPQDQDAAEAMVQVDRLSRLASVTVTDQSVANDSSSAGDVGAAPTTLQVEAHGTYTAIILFLSKLQEMVEARAGKLYVHGRLMNVTNLTVKTPDAGTSGDGVSTAGKESLPPGHISFSITIKLYSSAPGTTTSATPDATAAAGTTPATGAAATTAGAQNQATGTGTTTSPSTTTPSSTSSTSTPSVPAEKS